MTDASPSLLVRMLGGSVRRPWTTLVVAGAVTALAAVGAARIRPTGSIQAMLAEDDPASQALARITEAFGVADELIVVATAPPDADRSAARSLLIAFAHRLDDTVRSSGELSAVCVRVAYENLPEARRFVEREMVPAGLFYMNDDQTERLRARLTPERMREQLLANERLIATPGAAGHALRRTVLEDPLRLHELLIEALAGSMDRNNAVGDRELLLSADGRSLMVRIRGAAAANDIEFSKRLMSAVCSTIDRINNDALVIEYTGAYAIATTSERSIRGDMTRSIVLSVIFLSILFLLVYRHPLSFPLTAAPVAMGIVLAFGVGSFYSTALTPVVAVIGAVLAGLGIDYSIHFVSHYRTERAAGLPHAPAVEAALINVGPAMIAACLTSVVGFAAIALSHVQALRQFAIFGALGLAGSLVMAMTVLPALLGVAGGARVDGDRRRLLDRGLEPLLRMTARRPGVCAGVCGVLAIGMIVVFLLTPGGGLRFETDLTVMHPRPNPALDAQRRLGERFGRVADTLMVHLQADSQSTLTALAHQVDGRLGDQSVRIAGVAGTFGLGDLLPAPEAVTQRSAAVQSFDAERIIAEFRAALDDSLFDPAAYDDYLVFLRRLLSNESPPSMSGLRGYPSLAGLVLPECFVDTGCDAHDAVTTIVLDRALSDRAARDAAIETIRGALRDLPGATLTGLTVIGHDTERLIRHDLARLLAAAAAIVVGWLLAYFRSFRDAFMALLPALFGVSCLLGVMDLADLRLNMVNMIGIPLLVGIGVDDGIFLVTLARTRRAKLESPGDLLASMNASCHAVAMTTLSTLLTFGTLAFTSTPAIVSLGVMLTIGMIACLAGTLFLLAPLLLRSPRGV